MHALRGRRYVRGPAHLRRTIWTSQTLTKERVLLDYTTSPRPNPALNPGSWTVLELVLEDANTVLAVTALSFQRPGWREPALRRQVPLCV